MKSSFLYPIADILGTVLTVRKDAGNDWFLEATRKFHLDIESSCMDVSMSITETLMDPSRCDVTAVLLTGLGDLGAVVLMDHVRGVAELYMIDLTKVQGRTAHRLLPKGWSRKVFLFSIRNAVLERYTSREGQLGWAATMDAPLWVRQYLMARELPHSMSSDSAMGYADAVDAGAIKEGEFRRWSISTDAHREELMKAVTSEL